MHTISPVSINSRRLLERFLRYVRIDTAADPTSDTYPSTSKQRTLAKILADELAAMSIVDAHVDENSLVWGTVPATNGAIAEDKNASPTVAFVAHMDTSPEAPSAHVDPHVIECYEGGDIPLLAGNAISLTSSPLLSSLLGKTLITTGGTTLLGGDDKAGIAIIMELAQTLIEHPHLQHGDVRILFTCDEEIGRGTDKIDLSKLNAMVAYTIDGGEAGVIDVETFSADGATVRFVGNNIHPAIAKGVMANAMRAAADFVADLPRDRLTPETTSDREGFIHPNAISGGVGEAKVELILRSFDSETLKEYADIVKKTAESAAQKTSGVTAYVEIRRQYRNLREGLEDLPQAVEFAEQAFANLGRPSKREIVRGGTDGSQLTEKGLPTPNLSSGQYNIHSVQEFACLDQMVEAVEHLIELLALWSKQRM